MIPLRIGDLSKVATWSREPATTSAPSAARPLTRGVKPRSVMVTRTMINGRAGTIIRNSMKSPPTIATYKSHRRTIPRRIRISKVHAIRFRHRSKGHRITNGKSR
ncbi:MAG: hypothetical protein DMF49_12640 [Acidobacteria bacterium]|nr:MAG: hypothetical protein DMF49_12640 [Acidobacteriota bacterium]